MAVRRFINDVLEAGNWDIRDAFDDIMARDAEHEAEKTALRAQLAEAAMVARRHAVHVAADVPEDNCVCDACSTAIAIERAILAASPTTGGKAPGGRGGT